jgi:hypothetical protein
VTGFEHRIKSVFKPTLPIQLLTTVPGVGATGQHVKFVEQFSPDRSEGRWRPGIYLDIPLVCPDPGWC